MVEAKEGTVKKNISKIEPHDFVLKAN